MRSLIKSREIRSKQGDLPQRDNKAIFLIRDNSERVGVACQEFVGSDLELFHCPVFHPIVKGEFLLLSGRGI